MRLVLLGLCSLVAAGVFAVMFLAIWGTRRAAERAPTFGQNLASELVWAAIPCLIVLAAAIPAVMAIVSAR
jgi:heme/copper-type cytochrome/quinol oxidase subunit 2